MYIYTKYQKLKKVTYVYANYECFYYESMKYLSVNTTTTIQLYT